MTYHMFSGDTYQCGQCRAYYVPFEPGLPCPNCGVLATEHFDFVSEAAAGLSIHKEEYGHYSPEAFFVGGLPEHVFLLLCRAFDEVEESADMEAALRQHFLSSDWGDKGYLCLHVTAIALRILERMKTQ